MNYMVFPDCFNMDICMIGSPKEVGIYDYAQLFDSEGKGMKSFCKWHIHVRCLDSTSYCCMHAAYDGPVYRYVRDNHFSTRYFLSPASHHGNDHHHHKHAQQTCTCGHYVGDIGAAPIDRSVIYCAQFTSHCHCHCVRRQRLLV
jgi:hypothetical protein